MLVEELELTKAVSARGVPDFFFRDEFGLIRVTPSSETSCKNWMKNNLLWTIMTLTLKNYSKIVITTQLE